MTGVFGAAGEKNHHEHHEHHAESAVPAQSTLQGESLYHLKGSWKGANGKDFELKSLNGQLVVLTMAYTRCKVSCPMVVAKLKEIEAGLEKEKVSDFKIVMSSFDPKFDTPEKLAQFLIDRKLNPKRWVLLSPKSDRDVREMAAAIGLVYSRDKDQEYSHSNVIALLNKKGVQVKTLGGLSASHDDLLKAAKKESDAP